jgi:hypothetical protein
MRTLRTPLRKPRTKGRTPGPGRPPVHAEPWVKVSVVLFARQVSHLDRAADRSRQRGHKAVTRAGLIRGVLDGMLNTGMDLSIHATEAALRDHITKRLGRASRAL